MIVFFGPPGVSTSCELGKILGSIGPHIWSDAYGRGYLWTCNKLTKTCLKIHSSPQSIHRKVDWDLFLDPIPLLYFHIHKVRFFLSAHILEHEWKGEMNSTRIDTGVIHYVTHSHTYTSTFLFTLFHLFRIALYKFCLSWISNDECNLPFLLPNPN